MVTYDAARAPSSMFTELADQSKELHCVMHYVMHCVMHNVMHYVMHHVMHHVMHYTMRCLASQRSSDIVVSLPAGSPRPSAL